MGNLLALASRRCHTLNQVLSSVATSTSCSMHTQVTLSMIVMEIGLGQCLAHLIGLHDGIHNSCTMSAVTKNLSTDLHGYYD